MGPNQIQDVESFNDGSPETWECLLVDSTLYPQRHLRVYGSVVRSTLCQELRAPEAILRSSRTATAGEVGEKLCSDLSRPIYGSVVTPRVMVLGTLLFSLTLPVTFCAVNDGFTVSGATSCTLSLHTSIGPRQRDELDFVCPKNYATRSTKLRHMTPWV